MLTKFDYQRDFEKSDKEREDRRKYTDAQLASEKQTSFDSGVEEGRRLQFQEIESQILTILGGFEEKFSHFMEQESEKNKKLQKDSIELARVVATKLAISEAEKNAVERVVSSMEAATKTLLEQPLITIQVHADLCAPLAQRLQQMGKATRVKIDHLDNLPITDCQFSWGTGGAEISLQKTLQEIDMIIENAVEEESINVR